MANTFRRFPLVCAVVTIAGAAIAWAAAPAPRFYADDPLVREPESQDASRARPVDLSLIYDLSYNLFATPGVKASNVHAINVNTIDEVPDSSWFTNRIMPRKISAEDLVRGMIRLVNQLESGTSSIVFTLIACTFEALTPGVANRL